MFRQAVLLSLWALTGCKSRVAEVPASQITVAPGDTPSFREVPAIPQSEASIPTPPWNRETDYEQYGRVTRNFRQLKKGMTKHQVQDLVGKPHFGYSSDVWEWEFRDTGMADLHSFTVRFTDGLLARKGGAGVHFGRPD